MSVGLVSTAKIWFRTRPKVIRWLFAIQFLSWLAMLGFKLADSTLSRKVEEIFALNAASFGTMNFWTLFVHPFVHSAPDMLGLIINLAILGTLGSQFANRWRPTHFLFFWGTSSVFAGLVYLGTATLAPELFNLPVMGSQGSVMALLAAFWLVFGDRHYRIWGIEKPVRGRWVILAMLGLQVLFFALGRNPLICLQLGGFLAGWLLVTGRWRPAKFASWVRRLAVARKARRRGFRIQH